MGQKVKNGKYDIINKLLPSNLILRVYRHFKMLGKILLFFREKYILNHLKKDYEPILKKYKHKRIETKIEDELLVWVFWGQGEGNMPPVVKMCYESIRQAFPDREIKLLSLNNYKDYVKIDNVILNKFENKNITLTAFSDILRFAILERYGGIWCDATLYFLRPFELDIKEYGFYTLKHKPCKPQIEIEPSRAYWRAFFMATGKNNPLFECWNEIYNDYFKFNNTIPDYFFVDYIIRLCYKNIPSVKEMIDKVPEYSDRIYELYDIRNEKFDQSRLDDLTQMAPIQKMNWRGDFIDYSEDSEPTFFNTLLSKKFTMKKK